MHLTELTNEQRRQLIDVVQVFAYWRQADRTAVSGSLLSRKGAEYLYRKSGKSERSLGRRSPATEDIMNEHNRIRNRLRQTGARLKTMARVNRALYLNRVPEMRPSFCVKSTLRDFWASTSSSSVLMHVMPTR